MAKTRNRVELVGHLVADPEFQRTPAGHPCCWFTVETTEHWFDDSRIYQTAWEWHRIIAWGSLAQQCHQFLAWFTNVFLEGRLMTRELLTADGPRMVTEIILEDLIIFNSPPMEIRNTQDSDILKDYHIFGNNRTPWYQPPAEPDTISLRQFTKSTL